MDEDENEKQKRKEEKRNIQDNKHTVRLLLINSPLQA
jgi:hypothetical protein